MHRGEGGEEEEEGGGRRWWGKKRSEEWKMEKRRISKDGIVEETQHCTSRKSLLQEHRAQWIMMLGGGVEGDTPGINI